MTMTFLRSHLCATAVLCLLLCSCAAPGGQTDGGRPEDHYRWLPAMGESVGWALFLPGSSGLSVFGDDNHYRSVASELNQAGIDVLMVDYKPAYRAASDAPDVDTGEKIAWVAERAVDWMQRELPKTQGRCGSVVAWSMGAEGALRMINDADLSQRLCLRSAVFYYPSNRAELALRNRVPLLLMVGQADDVTPAEPIAAWVNRREASAAAAEVVIYPDAQHGFDIASIRQRKTIRVLPLVGPKATLQYQPMAARDSLERLRRFLGATLGTR